MSIPIAFKDYINEPVKRETIRKRLLKGYYLSKDEALQDYETFKYIFDNAYSGKEYFENKGVSFIECYNEIENFISSKEKISGSELSKKYYETFKDKLIDNHLSFIVNEERLTFSKLFSAYFTDILIERRGNKLFVLSSKIESIKKDDVVTCDQSNLFPTLSPDDRHFFLYGRRSWDEIDNMNIKINSENRNVSLHKCKAQFCKTDKAMLSYTAIDLVNIVGTPSFNIENKDFANELFSCGEKLRNEKNVIWNLLSNCGGDSIYPMSFIKGLNDYAHWESDFAALKSPAISADSYKENEKAYREWILRTSEPNDLQKGSYSGNLYVLINSKVISSGEAAVAYSKSVKNSLLIGENTMGCGTFGDTLTYRLPFSNMMMVVPCKLFLGMFNEGEGFTPDYWIDEYDVQGEVIKWLNNPSEYLPLCSSK